MAAVLPGYDSIDRVASERNRRSRGRQFVAVAAVGGSIILWSAAITGGLISSEDALSRRTVVDDPTSTTFERTAARLSVVIDNDEWIKEMPGRWSGGSGSGDARSIEEHLIRAPCFGEQTYAYWRYALNGPRSKQRVEAVTYAYRDSEELYQAVENEKLSAHAMVFVDVRYTALDYEYDFSWARRNNLTTADVGNRPRLPGLDEQLLDPTCVYDYTPNLFLRSRLLRALFSYREPLTIVVSGDVACRLRIPGQTHHNVIISNDAGGVQCSGSSSTKWWPQGLEGLSNYDFDDECETDALSLTNAEWIPLSQRAYLLNDAISVNWRKPSRIALVDALLHRGAREELENQAKQSNLGLRLQATIAGASSPVVMTVPSPKVVFPVDPAKYNGNSWRAAMAGSVFALCPAGDVYSTGRVVAAMSLGTIPIIDATYESDDGVSAKGCEDPAEFWRNGSEEFPRKAPFVFVSDWADLPKALSEVDVEKTLEEMRDYRDALESHLRDAVFSRGRTPPFETACATEPLDEGDRAILRGQAVSYYAQGPTPTSWFDLHKDRQETPGATCASYVSTEMTGVDIGALCFDAACAPPLVKEFICGR